MCERVGHGLFTGVIMKNLGLILTAVIFGAVAQLSVRKMMLQVGEVSFSPSLIKFLPAMLTNIFLWIGLFCYGVSFFFWVITVSRVDIGFAYAFMSLGFVVVTVMGHFLFGEYISVMRIAGLLLICIGLCVIARG
jgi:multidrug transporter EmrE-like cation transporter